MDLVVWTKTPVGFFSSGVDRSRYYTAPVALAEVEKLADAELTPAKGWAKVKSSWPKDRCKYYIWRPPGFPRRPLYSAPTDAETVTVWLSPTRALHVNDGKMPVPEKYTWTTAVVLEQFPKAPLIDQKLADVFHRQGTSLMGTRGFLLEPALESGPTGSTNHPDTNRSGSNHIVVTVR